jgi:TusA-related sulfurtransferase
MILYGFFEPLSGLLRQLTRTRRSTVKRVELQRHGTLGVDISLEFIGDGCLRTNLLTKNALDRARAGEIIEIVSDNLSSVETIPFMLVNHNCVHLATMHDQQCWKIYIRKHGAGQNGGAHVADDNPEEAAKCSNK